MTNSYKIMKLNIKYWREKRGYSQEALARACHLSYRTVQEYESGNKKQYSHKILETFCEVLNIEPGELFVWEISKAA